MRVIVLLIFLGPGLIYIGVYDLTGHWGRNPPSNQDLVAGTVWLVAGSVVTIFYIRGIVRSVRRRRQQRTPPSFPPPGWYPDPTARRSCSPWIIAGTAGAVVVAIVAVLAFVLIGHKSASRQVVLPFTGLTPEGVAVDNTGAVYVADQNNNRVLKLPAGATTPTTLPFTGLNAPLGVAVDSAGNVYVADNGNKQVVKLASGSSIQTVLPFTDLTWPFGVAVDTAGNVYVANSQAGPVFKLAAASSTQTELPITGLTAPEGVAVDTAGNVYVADNGNANATSKHQVVKLASGSSTQTVLPFTDVEPRDVAVDTAGTVYIADQIRDRVLKLPPH